MKNEIERIVILYTRISGYLSACLRTLKDAYNIQILLYRWQEFDNAPFDTRLINFIDFNYIRSNEDTNEIIKRIEKFDPQALYISGWTDKGYVKTAKTFRNKGIPIISGMDAQWKGTVRQIVACQVARWYLHPAIDILWVPGERQRVFAKKLGYTGNCCWNGMYTCDWVKFANVIKNRSTNHSPFFLYVGRYVDVKGIDILTQAYELYRTTVEQPWSLVCAGAGPLKFLLQNKAGIDDRGFFQPDALPKLMGESSAFILPSRKEAWGVVIQEAAASGLPIICSEATGASVHLVQDGYNGFVVESGNPMHLSEKMIQLHRLSREQRYLMGERSHELSKQYTPQRWAETLVNGLKTWQEQNRTV